MLHNTLKTFLILIVLTGTLVMGKVLPGTLHPAEMFVLDLSIQTKFSGGIVSCAKMAIFEGGPEGTNIAVIFNRRWQGYDNLGEVGFILGAVGVLTRETSWHSDYLVIVYKDKTFACKTKAARVFARNVNTGAWSDTEVGLWLLQNLIIS